MTRLAPQQLIALAGFVLMASFSTAYAQNFDGKKINSVTVRYNGPRTVDEARIRGYMSTRAGQKYSAARLDDDVRSLYESGLVDDIRFFAESAGGGERCQNCAVFKLFSKTPKWPSAQIPSNNRDPLQIAPPNF